MKIHFPSYLFGIATASILFAGRRSLRPVVVELGAVGLEMTKILRAIVDRQRENWEDLRAEVKERLRERLRRQPPWAGNGVTSRPSGGAA